ncbi:hypothetical protein GXM_05366 [Nostoc sphaeroides CCNUC1]|uniref:Uncharacterized protein n=1 Tax=Nostoc sphaeroides CCNUC1 TaxID=2653204 RepID=A0A5P8W5F1_9NOSO|nr:hypothetical protein GXM_05366 [Nostoc sphaeroides CCNUC1]
MLQSLFLFLTTDYHFSISLSPSNFLLFSGDNPIKLLNRDFRKDCQKA